MYLSITLPVNKRFTEKEDHSDLPMDLFYPKEPWLPEQGVDQKIHLENHLQEWVHPHQLI